MHPAFAALAERLHEKYEALLACPPHTGGGPLPLTVPARAVYLFSEGDDALYVGRTNRLRGRYKDHGSLDHNDAPFAFKLAREHSGHLKAKGGLTRKALCVDETFAPSFAAMSARVKNMEFRWVAENDPNQQFLLEFYAALALGTRYNDFDTH